MKQFDFSFKDIVENAKDVVIVTKAMPIDEPGPEIVYVNRAFTELTGYTADEVVGKNPRLLQSDDTDSESKRIIREALIEKKPVRTTIRNYSKHGVGYWLDISILPLTDTQGRVTHFAAIERDVTEQKELEDDLEKLTRTDPLTGVLNRRAFEESIKNEFSRFKRTKQKYTLLMLDIDHFKKINDTHGHNSGDIVLKAIAQICQLNLRRHDSISRLGGEEFCLILPSTSRDLARSIADKLCQEIKNYKPPNDLNYIAVTVSIGVAEVEMSDKDEFDALKRSDEKLYEAKEGGRNRVCL